MAYQTVAKLMGDTTSYKLSPNVKPYTLRDLGFEVSKGGKYTLESSLDPLSPFNSNYRLKVAIDKDLKKLKLAAVASNGLREVNLFKGPEDEVKKRKDQLNFIMTDLLKREVLEKVD